MYRSGQLPLEQVNPDTTEDEEEGYDAGAEEITTRLETQTPGVVIIKYTPTTLMLHILRSNSQTVPFKV